MWLDEISRSGTTVEMCLRYQGGANQWRHYFSASILEDEEIDLCLAQTGFAPVRWINRSWGLANAAHPQRAKGGLTHRRNVYTLGPCGFPGMKGSVVSTLP
jgi:hypothetical protein